MKQIKGFNEFFMPFGDYRYLILHSVEQYKQYCMKANVAMVEIPNTFSACVISHNDLSVLIMPNDEFTGSQRVGIIAHECVHIWQNFINYISEINPSDEFMAYTIQSVLENALNEDDKR